jgi:drug/metabolite transporter (DMT)-like permease
MMDHLVDFAIGFRFIHNSVSKRSITVLLNCIVLYLVSHFKIEIIKPHSVEDCKMCSKAWIYGFLGVIIFAGSLPATKLAMVGFEVEFLTAARAAIAGMVAMLLLLCTGQPMPARTQLAGLSIVAFGVVLGFPLFTALALQSVSAAYAIIFVALLPLFTAISGVLSSLAANHHYAWQANLYLLLAVVFCSFGYAQGGKLSRALGGWQVICWALLLALPVMFWLSMLYWPSQGITHQPWAIGALLYVSLFSMLLGFVFWYQALAQGGIVKISQLQLLQPFLGLVLSALLLNEQMSWSMLMICIVVVICIAGAKKYS